MSGKVVTLAGADFKELASKVTRFPGLGMFGGSDLVHIACGDGMFRAATSGVVLAIGQKRCDGFLPLSAVDERVLTNFAGIVPDSGIVKIQLVGNELQMTCRRSEIQAQLIPGVELKGPDLRNLPRLKLTPTAAERIRYLANIAYNDVTRPELCCVMLGKTGNAYAMDQKAVAVLQTGLKAGCTVPVPLPIARNVEAGNSLYISATVTAMRSGCVVYSMPSLVAATKSYPFGLAQSLRQDGGKSIGTVDGVKFSGMLEDCLKCLGQLTRTESSATLRLSADKLELRGQNGGTKFDTSVKAVGKRDKTFGVPLESLARIRPFLTGDVQLGAGKHGDLYLYMEAGWSMFPGEEADRK